MRGEKAPLKRKYQASTLEERLAKQQAKLDAMKAKAAAKERDAFCKSSACPKELKARYRDLQALKRVAPMLEEYGWLCDPADFHRSVAALMAEFTDAVEAVQNAAEEEAP